MTGTAPATTPPPSPSAAAALTNPALVDGLYSAWKADPSSVGADWQVFFAGFELGHGRPAAVASAPAGSGGETQQRVDGLIYAYRDGGHTIADLDPLGLANQTANPQLELSAYGLSDADLDHPVATNNVYGLGDSTTLRGLIDHLRKTYCRTIAVEYQHIQDRERRHWVRERLERDASTPAMTREQKHRILAKLNEAETLETFIHTKFLGQKRFSLEGGESMMPALDTIIEMAPDLGAKEVVMGMAHRGRLNVLCNTLQKTHEEIFTEFEGSYDISELQGDGDVKYHQGFSSDYTTSAGKRIHLTLSANPSHLEAVNPVVLGRARGKQRQHRDTKERTTVVPLLIHGDAAFAGQGLVMEVLQMSQLEGYTVGGTIHLVLNNQIGFTALPEDSRSTRYCTDLAKMLEAPIFHVNGDDPEAVVHVARLALEYRQKYHRDVFIDLVCYRRHGHNETDEPAFTQPTMYARIATHPRIAKRYADRLLAAGDITAQEIEGTAIIKANQLQAALTSVKVKPAKLSKQRFTDRWKGITNTYTHDPVATGAKAEALDRVARTLTSWPTGFNIHPKIKRLCEDRLKAVAERGRIDWAWAELLAFGTLIGEGFPCRLSGQDCRRGTFSSRHAVFYDTSTRERYQPFKHLVAEGERGLCVYDSFLSEAAVLGFDYGYTLAEPNMLIVWEAQFGDFANGAQVIIDQFLTAAESKWGRASALVMMLPHGQEGAGPEHSSGRLERYLQACAEDNIQVAYCTTAAQHFHILRRQMLRQVRKPLILMTPKSHLRSKEASSPFDDLVTGCFQEVIGDGTIDPAKVERVVITGGKVYHELAARREAEKIGNTAIIRIEQLYPLHEAAVVAALKPYTKAKTVLWCQEEPQNMGAWSFLEPYLRRLLAREIGYAGREAAASPAPGSPMLFQIEQEALLSSALGIPARKVLKGHH